MIKYIGSKRRLVPAIVRVARSIPSVKSVCDLFAGTTRVGQGLKRAGLSVWSNDLATYSEVLGTAFIATDRRDIDEPRILGLLEHLQSMPPVDGYFTETYCRRSRYFQPANGERIDAIRLEIDRVAVTPVERAILLASLLIAADRVDSTTGLQMAYLKRWSPRSYNPLVLALPNLIPGSGRVTRRDANRFAREFDGADLTYIDPPYNQHSYFGNYHVWESLVRNDAPEVYGVACKRIDCRERRSLYNSRPRCEEAFADLIEALKGRSIWLLVSFNDEGYIGPGVMREILQSFGEVASISIDYPRYVGSRIGVYNPQGVRVGRVSHTRNREWLFLCGPDADECHRALYDDTDSGHALVAGDINRIADTE